MSFDPQLFDQILFGAMSFDAVFDGAIFDSAVYDTGEEVVAPAAVTGGSGSAAIIYKRPHKKVHDEIEGYFARLTETEADGLLMEAQVLVGSEEARHAVANSLHQRAVERVARMIEDERRDELRALLALAQDEDDAEAVVLMLETLH